MEIDKSILDNITKTTNEIEQAMMRLYNSEPIKKMQGYCETISKLQILGRDYNWVVVDVNVDLEIVKKDKSEVDNYFVFLLENNHSLYLEIKKLLLDNDFLIYKRNLLKQIFEAIEHKKYEIACVSLSTILEYLLAFESDPDSTKVRMLLEKFIDNVGEISISEYEIGFLFSLEGFLMNYVKSTNGFGKDKEPKYVNRHWIAHGRMYRELTKIDTYQILLAIYAFIRIMNMERCMKLDNDVIQ